MRIPVMIVAIAAASALAACGGSTDKAASAYSKDDFNKNFNALMAAVPSHFQDIVGEKIGNEGIVGVFNSKIDLPGTTGCQVKNTADDKATVVCDQGYYENIDDAKKAYATIRGWAIAAKPSDAVSADIPGDPGSAIVSSYAIRANGAQAMVGVVKDDDSKKYEVGFVFGKPQ